MRAKRRRFRIGRFGQPPFEWIAYAPAISGWYEILVSYLSTGGPRSELGAATFSHGSISGFIHRRTRHSQSCRKRQPRPTRRGRGILRGCEYNQYFSSRGPMPDDRTKPDIVGVDCAVTSTDASGYIRPNWTTMLVSWHKPSGGAHSGACCAGQAALPRNRTLRRFDMRLR